MARRFAAPARALTEDSLRRVARPLYTRAPSRRVAEFTKPERPQTLLQDLLAYLAEKHFGEATDLLGVLGFGVTIWQVMRARSAAEHANRAVLDVKKRLASVDIAMELTSAIALMDEIRRHHRSENWMMLPDRYSVLKRHLITIRRSSHTSLSDEERTTIQSAITQFTMIETQIERCLHNEDKSPNVSRLNSIVAQQIDAVFEVVIAHRGRLQN